MDRESEIENERGRVYVPNLSEYMGQGQIQEHILIGSILLQCAKFVSHFIFYLIDNEFNSM